MNPELELEQDRLGQLRLKVGQDWIIVSAIRAFPITEPRRGISLVDADGHERAWIDELDTLPTAQVNLIAAALGSREFIPEIRRITAVSSFVCPSVWTVETDRGVSHFTLKGEEDIRRFRSGSLLVADRHGVQYLIRDLGTLDRHSRKLLDRFM
jgi:hypothetical protein